MNGKKSCFLFFFLFYLSSFILAQNVLAQSSSHTRLYACALGSDDPAAFMGGSSIGGGLWQSDDTGRSWKQLGWKHVKCYSVDVVAKSNGNIIYQACGNGVLKSTDAGANWRMVTDWRITEVMDIAIDQNSPNNIYIATAGAIWKSNDAGANWYEADTDIPYPIFVSRIKIDPSNHKKVFAATESGLYESKDGGSEWKKRPGKDSSVRDMILSNHGLSAYVESSGKAVVFEKKWTHKDSQKNLWAIAKYKNALYFGSTSGVSDVTGSPQNVHTLLTVGNNLFIGSLNGGVWKADLTEEQPACRKSGMDDLQIWRLKSIEIK
jgi:photosystem II stability/assembly factor-like uncharacterized protein